MATRGGGLDTLKPQRPKIKLVDKGFDDTTPAGRALTPLVWGHTPRLQ